MSDDRPDLEPIDHEPIDLEPIAPSAWPSGWYADPWMAGQYRYWNGEAWTGDVHRSGPAPGIPCRPRVIRSVPSWSNFRTR